MLTYPRPNKWQLESHKNEKKKYEYFFQPLKLQNIRSGRSDCIPSVLQKMQDFNLVIAILISFSTKYGRVKPLQTFRHSSRNIRRGQKGENILGKNIFCFVFEYNALKTEYPTGLFNISEFTNLSKAHLIPPLLDFKALKM